MRKYCFALLLIAGLSGTAGASTETVTKDPIIVTGDRAEEVDATADFAKAITWRPSQDKPLPKHYEPVCIRIFGLDADYANVMAQRMRDNMRALNLVLAGDGCAPTIWVGFVPDSHAEVTRLRKQEPTIFGDLRDFEIDRILAGSKASQAWFAREDKGVDGKALRARTIEIGGIQFSVRHNDPWRASRITGTIRVDMIGSIVLFDSKLSAGKSIRQLADYATFRALAPVRDLASEENKPTSILTLFAKDATAPAGLTEFDWAYLAGYYKLDAHAGVASVHDATKRAFLDGLGDKVASKAGGSLAE